ncbi:MAG: glycosyltransferase family 4 protein [Polaribacter sp.]
MNKNIVIISNYYPPEIGAAANRIQNLAVSLKDRKNKITVICPLPNYPKGKIFKNYKGKIYAKEILESIIVKRFWIFPSKSKKSIVRVFSMLSFAISLWFSLFSLIKKRPDVIIIQSPPLLVSFSALILSKVLFCKTILNVSDIWPLSALELKVIQKGFFYRFLEKIEKRNYKLATKIMGQSNEIITHINKIITKETIVYRNVPKYKEYKSKTKEENTLRIVYAGLLGYAQGILDICKEIDFKKLNVEFHIYGQGMEEDEIRIISNYKNKNIFFHGSKNNKEIKKEIIKYDFGFVPLKNRIYGAVPSKIFELMQLGTPILFFGEGEATNIIENNKIGFCSITNNYEDLRKLLITMNNLSNEEYKTLSNNCLKLHKYKYHLSSQIEKIYDNNFL